MTIDSHPLYLLLHHPKYHFPKLIILQIPHTGVLPINCKKFYAYFMKKIKLSFPAFPVLIAHVIIPAICKMGSQKQCHHLSFANISYYTNPRLAKIAIC